METTGSLKTPRLTTVILFITIHLEDRNLRLIKKEKSVKIRHINKVDKDVPNQPLLVAENALIMGVILGHENFEILQETLLELLTLETISLHVGNDVILVKQKDKTLYEVSRL